MSDELSELGFDAVEDWSVEDFYTFFHQVNILYNRLSVLEDIKLKQRQVQLKSALYGSLSRISPEERLKVKSIEIHSPGDFNLLGVDKIIGQVRELIKDLTYRNKLDRQEKEEALSHQKEMNSLKTMAGKQKVLANQIQLMKSLGYDQEQIEIGIKALADPLAQIEEISSRKNVTVKSPNKQSKA
ncbi:hypothetical protein C7H85_16140 [Zobellella endophytica]|uniref:Uncharacterized protein n=1 Tax=Zobellella endophytica TaxID=2116700 RepID=A0A2P7R0Q6_9GAMM|nr:hypothetical protein [Zobellella endophytica]PSJ43773.1 hypothetical protein C7H85_16140 [Zobellella endophytica]